MATKGCAAPACALLALLANIAAAQSSSAPDSLLQAQVALRFDPLRRCPDLRIADEGTFALVVFLVGVSGNPSQVSVRSSSQSASLDAAAVSCVLKLRFQPAIRAGDGVPIVSWQQLGWRWARQQEHHDGAAATASQAAVSPTNGTVQVRVCSDGTGRLAQEPKIISSSGDPGLDESALRIARSGSGNYRPATTVDGTPLSGCAQLSIKFETK
jgi:TonB family protein